MVTSERAGGGEDGGEVGAGPGPPRAAAGPEPSFREMQRGRGKGQVREGNRQVRPQHA